MLYSDICERPNQMDQTLLPSIDWSPETYGVISGGGRGTISAGPFSTTMFFDIAPHLRRNGQRKLEWVEGAMPMVLLSVPVKVPRAFGADIAQPVELGNIRLQAPKRPRLGQAAPGIQARREDGTLFDLAALKGKWVLLVFGANESSGVGTEKELTLLTNYRADAASDHKVEVAVLSLDADPQAITKLRTGQKLPWPSVQVGPWDQSKAAADYGVLAVPEIMLVSPGGRIAALHLRGQRLIDVMSALEENKAGKSASLQAAKADLAQTQTR
jgi:peroxiredoxin